MLRTKQVLRLGFVVLGVSAAVFWWGLSRFAEGPSFAEGLCGNQVLQEIPSPNGAHRAVVFERDCGATTGFSTQVSILDARESLPNDAGNAFIADTNDGAAPPGPGGGPAVRVRWQSQVLVSLDHHRAARVFKSERTVGDVRIEVRVTQ